MTLELKFFATFRDAVGRKTIHREFEDGTTVAEVLRSIEAEFDGLEDQFFEDGRVRDHVRILKNGQAVAHMEGGDTTLADGDTLSVFPPVAGGGRPCESSVATPVTADRG